MRTHLVRTFAPPLLLGCAVTLLVSSPPAHAEGGQDSQPDWHGNYIQVGALPLSFWSTKYERKPEGQPVRKEELSSSDIAAVDPTLAFRAGIASFVARAELSQNERLLQLGYRFGALEAGLLMAGGQ